MIFRSSEAPAFNKTPTYAIDFNGSHYIPKIRVKFLFFYRYEHLCDYVKKRDHNRKIWGDDRVQRGFKSLEDAKTMIQFVKRSNLTQNPILRGRVYTE
jgi:hypothetical protein